MFDKRVVDPRTFQSYSYGYTDASSDEVDMANVDTLLSFS